MKWCRFAGIGAAAVFFASVSVAMAQDSDSASEVGNMSGASPPADDKQSKSHCTAPDETPIILPKMTIVVLRIDETLGSKISESGQVYDLTLAEPLMVDGTEILPAGLTGKGEVIHAKKAGGSGAAGELILAATHLEFEGRQIPLRSMKLGRTGGSNIGVATAIGASPLGPLGMLVSGKNTQVEAGTIAEAKLAQDFQVSNSDNSDNSVREKAPCLEGGTQ